MIEKTDKELQEYCDKKKYERGFVNSCDNSGMMVWCDYCKFQTNGRYGCVRTHESRQSECLCAKAYRQMQATLEDC